MKDRLDQLVIVGHGCSGSEMLRAIAREAAAGQDRIILADKQGRSIGQVKVPPIAQLEKVKYWTCNNCGHIAPQTVKLTELAFKWVAPLTSKTTCPNCGSYTLQQAYDETFKAGYFLVVKAYNGIRGKG